MIPDFNQVVELTAKIRDVNKAIQSKTASKEGLLAKIETCFEDIMPMAKAQQNGQLDKYSANSLFTAFNELKKNCVMLGLDKKNQKIASAFRNSLGGREEIRRVVGPFLSNEDLDSAISADKNWREELNFKILTFIKNKKLKEPQEKEIWEFAKEMFSEEGFISHRSTGFSTTTDDLNQILEKLLEVPEDQRGGVILALKQLIKYGNNRIEISQILSAIKGLPDTQRLSVLNGALRLIQKRVGVPTLQFMFKTLGKVGEGRDEVIHIAQKFVQEAKELEMVDVLNCIEDIPEEERTKAFEDAESFFKPEFSLQEKLSILSTVGNIPVAQRPQIFRETRKLISEESSGYYIDSILKSVQSLPLNDREQVVKDAINLVQGRDIGFRMVDVLKNLQEISGDRDQVVEDMRKQIAEEKIQDYDLVSFIKNYLKK